MSNRRRTNPWVTVAVGCLVGLVLWVLTIRYVVHPLAQLVLWAV